MRRQRLVTSLILLVLLLLAVGYIVFDKYAEMKQRSELNTFQRGAQYGYEQGILAVIQQAVTCQQVPLIVGNQTINIIAVDCIK
ncbi:hypothetical protein COV15_01380 [Candidatus Woesearchaeota archaeon CG10_big_fil_rev_8_21_14_0_10_34_12]|nr:MAG: hypothetical protein COV15_01380 [Candidatus Woesearchaeota archaeon CG10_big_fil_rev_8_21_14_0_10_34_12]